VRSSPPATSGDETDRPIDSSHVPETLSEAECAMLRLEQLRWKYPGAKDARIREDFGMSPTRYYQVLNALIDNPTALAFDPVTVRRLRRLRDLRRGNRTPGRDL
jgi:hypothetical protein